MDADLAEMPRDMSADADAADVADTGPADMSADLRDTDVPDDGGDLGGPQTCPGDARTPEFTSATLDAPLVYDLSTSPDVPEDGISIAAGVVGERARFITAHRADRSGELVTVVSAYAAEVVLSQIVGHAVAEPFTDVVVADAPDEGVFRFLASASTPTCDMIGVQAVFGELDLTSGLTLLNVDTINETCGTVVPRVAMTGPDGQSPNMRMLSTSRLTGDVLAYPWGDTVPMATSQGTSQSPHVSASTKDLVATPAANPETWLLWRPAFGDPMLEVDLRTRGNLEVEHLYDDCYIAAVPADTGAVLASVECDASCLLRSSFDVAIAAEVNRVDVAPMPGGGFVLVTPRGAPARELEARFFDDAYQPAMIDGQHVIVVATSTSFIGDFEVATVRDGEATYIGVAYSVFGVEPGASLSVIRLSSAP